MDNIELLEYRPEPEVFDFGKNWSLIEPHLDGPEVLAALQKGMDEFCEAQRKDLLNKGHAPNRISHKKYDPAKGPWFNTPDRRWLERARLYMELAIDRGEFQCRCTNPNNLTNTEREEYDRFEEQFFPRPGSYQWFQCFHACHWLAKWLQELGKRVYPELRWGIMRGDCHSLAYGMDCQNEIRMIFDILGFDGLTAPELIEFASRKDPRLEEQSEAETPPRQLGLKDRDEHQNHEPEVSLAE